ncbi:MAG: bifunctional (p)ppGpp synthetase/guanosine-3',5'-bis(diphosphate) 3'-pyrophosphohydrolase [Nitrospirae bacterium]|nr:bifunctional (p)ppGpp synthetase/guanosine-3',5'-bis(diphosphate) 3'-pyrophosphohydrolase [Nitrospirota bacterium]
MLRFEDIIEKIQSYQPDCDTDLLRRAYIFSARAHQGVSRMSGEPYMVHPIEVAGILSDLKLDYVTVTAGLLHDTVEDSDATVEEIAEYFGDEVALIVDGLTKLAKIEFKTREEQQAENFRKMILAMSKDIRVIMIKLADRLHNMRTLQYLKPERQKAIAQETLDIYAPLANRLGLGRIKWDLEDLCLQYIDPEVYQDIVSKISKKREDREDYIQELIAIVNAHMDRHGLPGRVLGRPKHFYSIYQKMLKQGITVDEMYDLIALRIITDTTANCYAMLGMIHSLWLPVPGRFKDFIGVPKSNRYQSLHTTVIGPKGERVEFQIRTEEMHRVAESGIAAHWQYKEKGKVAQQDEKAFSWLRQLVEYQKEVTDSREFLDTLKIDLFTEVVYVFTPRGDVKELTMGSTPVDFAYSIHTDVGNQCVGAKVNGKMVPLKYQFKNGDEVEIITQAGHVPSRDWLKFVKTSKARTRIKHWLKQEEIKQSLELGREIFEKELKKHNINPLKLYKSPDMGKVLDAAGQPDADSLLREIGFGKISARQAITPLLPEEAPLAEMRDESLLKKVARKLAIKREKGVRIKGIDDIMIHFSKCCNPVPGDKIVGFVTRGKGVSIHASDCPNLYELEEDRERIIEVEWDVESVATYSAKITVFTVDKPGLLANVSTAIAAADSNISHADVTTSEDKRAVLNFVIEIKDTKHLERVMKKVGQVDGVVNVKRVTAG